jgi:RND family efflux transporter MFP subunit
MSGGSATWKSRKKAVIWSALVVAGVLGFGAFRLAKSAVTLPMADVKRKEFVDYLEIKGEVKAIRSAVIAAPYGAGDMQILRLVDNAAKVKKGDFLVEFDATAVKEEQDVTDVMTAKYDAEKARMDAGKQEILSVIEGEQAKLKLADAEQKLKENEAKLKADRAAAVSDLASKQQKHDQATFQVQLDERALDSLTLRAPLDGVVALQNHWQPQGSPTTFKPGDRAWPGAAIAELPDGSALKISARVEEAERGQLKLGQTANVRLDALPDRSFEGHVETISPTASLDFGAGWPVPRNFAVELSLTGTDTRLAPGMGATVRIAVARVPDGIVIPTNALFRKAGRTVAYVRRGSKFEETAVEVSKQSGDEALIAKGLQAGEHLALKDPTLAK